MIQNKPLLAAILFVVGLALYFALSFVPPKVRCSCFQVDAMVDGVEVRHTFPICSTEYADFEFVISDDGGTRTYRCDPDRKPYGWAIQAPPSRTTP